MQLLILTVEEGDSGVTSMFLSSGRGHRLSMSRYLTQTTRCSAAHLFPANTLSEVYFLTHRVCNCFPISFITAHLTGLFFNLWISSIDRKKAISSSLFLLLRHTPMFSGWRQELARHCGWVWCNWNWCKGLRVALFFTSASSSLQHSHAFPKNRWRKNMTDFQNVAGSRGSHFC